MKDGPAFQLYAADFYMDTVEWSATQVGIYFRLLMYEWVNGALPNNEKRLARIGGIDPGNFKKAWVQDIAKKFSPNGDGNLINHRMEKVRIEQQEYREKQKESGLRGVEVKKEKGIFPFDKSSDPSTDPSSNPATQNQALQSSSSSSPSLKKERASSHEYTEDQIQEIILKSDKLCKSLNSHFKKAKFNAFQWRQQKINKAKHPIAVIDALQELWKYRESTNNPWPYLNSILTMMHQNYNEASAIQKHDNIKREMEQIARGLMGK